MTRSKILKKIGTAMLAAVMMISLVVPAFAEGTGGGNHKIIIKNVVPEATYKVYKLLDLVVETKDDAGSPTGKAVKSYRYTFSDGLKDIVSYVAGLDDFKYNKDAANAMGFDVNQNKNNLVFQVPDGIETDTALQAKRDGLMLRFADALRVEIEKKGAALEPERTIPGSMANVNHQIVIDDLADGYWMVTSNAGARSIVFTNPSSRNGNMVIQEKNAKPTVQKTANTDIAGVGDQVEYTIRANAGAGSESLVVVDTMSKGLRFDKIVSVKFKPSRGGDDVTMPAGTGGYTFVDKDDKGNNGFRLTIDPNFLKSVTFIGDANTMTDDGGTFEVVYFATITGDAVELNKVTNSAKLQYGHNPDSLLETKPGGGGVEIPDLDPDKTYTVKWVDENGNPIPGINDVTINPGDPFPMNPSRNGRKGYWEDPVGPDENRVIIIRWHPGAVEIPDIDPEETYTVRWVDEHGNPIPEINDVTINPGDSFPVNPSREGMEGYWEDPVGPDENNVFIIKWHPDTVNIPDLDSEKTYTVKWVDEFSNPIPGINDVTIKPGDPFPVNPDRRGMEGYWEDPVGPDENRVIIIKWHPAGTKIPDIDPEKTYTVKWVDENYNPIPGINDVTINPGDSFPVNPSRGSLEGYWENPVGPDENNVFIIKWHPGGESGESVVEIDLHQVDLLKHVQGDKTAVLANARFSMFRNPVTGTVSAAGLAVPKAGYDKIVEWSTSETPNTILPYDNGKVQGLVRFFRMEDDAAGNYVYRPAVVYEADGETFTAEYNNAVTVIETPATGRIIIKGLGSGLYSCKETEAPAGYNKLEDPAYLAVQDGGNAGKYVYTQSSAANMTFAQSDDNTLTIANASGLQMPSTGGIGTTIFYITGAALVLGAGILLIMKKRKGGNER